MSAIKELYDTLKALREKDMRAEIYAVLAELPPLPETTYIATHQDAGLLTLHFNETDKRYQISTTAAPFDARTVRPWDEITPSSWDVYCALPALIKRVLHAHGQQLDLEARRIDKERERAQHIWETLNGNDDE